VEGLEDEENGDCGGEEVVVGGCGMEDEFDVGSEECSGEGDNYEEGGGVADAFFAKLSREKEGLAGCVDGDGVHFFSGEGDDAEEEADA